MTINCRGSLIELSEPKIMGILNLGPNSFYDGGRHGTIDQALRQTEKMLTTGASFIDIGAATSKPGATLIDAEEEKKRLLPTFEALIQAFPEMFFSIDTYNSATAKSCLERGAAIINDISAGNIDPKMIATVGSYTAVYIGMHMQGKPENMQQNPAYQNLIPEILAFFSKKKQEAFQAGINDFVIDPGFGFGKTIANNFELLQNLEAFKRLRSPLMVGLSRKSMIYKVLETTPDKALNGTTVLHTISLIKGAHFLRVHDVAEAKECIRLLKMLP